MKTPAAALLLLLTLPVMQPAAAQTPAADDRDETVRKLSPRERRDRTAKLEVRFRDFLEDVEPIIIPAELDMFLTLESEGERSTFVDEFWRRRDHVQRTTAGAFREMYYRRLEAARQLFKKTSNDRAKVFLILGAPQKVTNTNCARILQPIEIWHYDALPRLGTDVRLLFYKPRHSGELRLWNPMGGSVALAELAVSTDAIGGRSAEEGRPRPGQTGGSASAASPYAYINRIQLECSEGMEIMMAISGMIQNRVDVIRLLEPPELDAEDTQKILRTMVIANPNAPKLSADFAIAYPTKEGSRTGVQMTLLVPRSELSPAEVGGQEVYTIDVTGEVLKDGGLWEKYRYRFDYPGDVTLEKLPIVIDRVLRPAQYVSRVKVTDANGGGEALVERTIEVPEIFVQEPVAVADAADASPQAAATTTEEEAPDPNAVRLRIVPPSDDVVTGLETIDTIATGAAIKAVEFSLDGRKVAVRRSEPWSVGLDFGEIPQPRTIRAVALDAKGEPITGDELTVNAGTDPFRVRIVSPRIAPRLTGRTRVEMEVTVPDDRKLASLELFWNEQRMATLYAEPFIQSIDIPATEGVGYLRAVATLEGDDIPPVEDAVVINTPAYMEQLNVHLIELPTTVTASGKPVDGLTAAAFTVLDEGKPVTIARFEHVSDVPLSIGMAIDSSGSMMNRMDEAQKAGAQFFEKIMRKGDKAFLVTFDTTPRLAQKWSSKIADVHAGLASVRAEDKTALYDAVVYALYNFQGIRGQRALVVISDGRDTASKFTFDQMIEYARRSGVPVYGIGIGIRSNDTDVRFKLDRLCRETGGATYYIDQARELQRVYDDIETELRSQYILGFYPPADAKTGKWREVSVDVKNGKAKTVKGYVP